MKLTTKQLLDKISGHSFKNESDLSRYFESIAPAFFGINKNRVVSELRTTSHDSTLSNLTDMVILDNVDRSQVLVAFEFKLDKSINRFKKSDYESAEKQLHKYCQDLKAPYGVLLSEKICKVFHYQFRGSMFTYEEVLYLPELTDIEKEINNKNNRLIEKIKKPLLITGAILLFFAAIWAFRGSTGSEYVNVKYRDTKVDVASFEYLDGGDSSFVREAWYDDNNQYMIINLNGTNYHYCGLPSSTWDSLRESSSLGSFYNSSIKGHYDCRVNPVPSY